MSTGSTEGQPQDDRQAQAQVGPHSDRLGRVLSPTSLRQKDLAVLPRAATTTARSPACTYT